MPDCGFINTVVCPGESSCQAQEADGAERTRKESEKLVLFLAPQAPGLGFLLFVLLCFSVHLCIYMRSFFPPLLRPEDKSWNGTRRRSADGSAAYESALISSQRGISSVFCLSVCSSAVWFLSFVFFSPLSSSLGFSVWHPQQSGSDACLRSRAEETQIQRTQRALLTSLGIAAMLSIWSFNNLSHLVSNFLLLFAPSLSLSFFFFFWNKIPALSVHSALLLDFLAIRFTWQRKTRNIVFLLVLNFIRLNERWSLWAALCWRNNVSVHRVACLRGKMSRWNKPNETISDSWFD